ncbi:MAG: DUF3037 domain-containing protein [Planctomycetes bacterium]|nr:DUF3037 domain-containing protein [Planctomycetota bacterium]
MTEVDRSAAYYSLIQYCPDRGRAEVANVGALLFTPLDQVVRVRTISSMKRVRRVFGVSIDGQRVKRALRAFADAIESDADRRRFKTLDDLRRFIATRANEFVLTQPRGARSEHAADTLDRIFEEYVSDGAVAAASGMAYPRRQLEAVAARLLNDGRTVKLDYAVAIPNTDRKVHADIVYLNGTTNLVRCLPEIDVPAHADFAAQRAGSEAQMLRRSNARPFQREPKLIVVSGGLPNSDANLVEQRIEDILRYFEGAELVRANALEAFADRMAREAK